MASETLAELHRLRGSWEYAFANAPGPTWGDDPRLAWVHQRERELLDQLLDEARRGH